MHEQERRRVGGTGLGDVNARVADLDLVMADYDARPCPIGRASSVLGDRWILLILRDATIGITRFDGFRDHLGIG
jgi:DNA-binding HxlR family transcriptional regulator